MIIENLLYSRYLLDARETNYKSVQGLRSPQPGGRDRPMCKPIGACRLGTLRREQPAVGKLPRRSDILLDFSVKWNEGDKGRHQ